MNRPIRFRLNEQLYEIDVREEALALDWIRNEAGLKGTKEGCREGDCGACLVLLGGKAPAHAVEDGRDGVEWRSVTSCTLAMGELDGRHLVTIEGLASLGLTPVMEAMLDEGASQCGFCSPGFILALTGFLVSGAKIDPVEAMIAVEGNLCRCTGYGSIRRAATILARDFADLPTGLDARMDELARRKVLPPELAAMMKTPPAPVAGSDEPGNNAGRAAGAAEAAGSQATVGAVTAQAAPGTVGLTTGVKGATATGAGGPAAPAPAGATAPVLGGGTDYFVRNPDPQPGLEPLFVYHRADSRSIRSADRGGRAWIELGAAVNATDFFTSKVVRASVPGIERFEHDIASPPIRNRATLAGNIANASPIADMTAMLIALGAELDIAALPLSAATAGARPVAGTAPQAVRSITLESFFLGYKKIDLGPGEVITGIRFPADWSRFTFEKAAKRDRLDIATVNCAAAVRLDGNGVIADARWSAGGVAATPLRLATVEEAMRGRTPNAALAREVGRLAAEAGSPMSDVRGSAAYRKRLLERLAWATFIRLWPELRLEEDLLK